LGRALETLLPCAEILVVDHESSDTTHRIARQYGARIVGATHTAGVQEYLDLVSNDWIFCLEPRESLTENLQVSLFEWSALPPQNVAGASAFFLHLREQVGDAWTDFLTPEVRLVRRNWTRWSGQLPAYDPSAIALQGELLRFAYP
jgi:hypothetical protein